MNSSISENKYFSLDSTSSGDAGAIRLVEGKGVDGALEGLVDGPVGLIMATISGIQVELPCILKSRLEPLKDQPVRVAFLCGKYHACKMTRRAKV